MLTTKLTLPQPRTLSRTAFYPQEAASTARVTNQSASQRLASQVQSTSTPGISRTERSGLPVPTATLRSASPPRIPTARDRNATDINSLPSTVNVPQIPSPRSSRRLHDNLTSNSDNDITSPRTSSSTSMYRAPSIPSTTQSAPAMAVLDRLQKIESVLVKSTPTVKDAPLKVDIEKLRATTSGRLQLLALKKSVHDPNYDPFELNYYLSYSQPQFRNMNVLERILIDNSIMQEKLDLMSALLIEVAQERRIDVQSVLTGDKKNRRERTINKMITRLLEEVYDVESGKDIPAWGSIADNDRRNLVTYIHGMISQHRKWAGHDENDTKFQVKQQVNTWRSKKARTEQTGSQPHLPAARVEDAGNDTERSEQVEEELEAAIRRRRVAADARDDYRDESEIRRRSTSAMRAVPHEARSNTEVTLVVEQAVQRDAGMPLDESLQGLGETSSSDESDDTANQVVEAPRAKRRRVVTAKAARKR